MTGLLVWQVEKTRRGERASARCGRAWCGVRAHIVHVQRGWLAHSMRVNQASHVGRIMNWSRV
jgi:hypothetical protein